MTLNDILFTKIFKILACIANKIIIPVVRCKIREAAALRVLTPDGSLFRTGRPSVQRSVRLECRARRSS